MPRLNKAIPKYQRHRASGQAVVTLDGRDFYLGPHGTTASKLEYDRLIAERLQNGRRLLSAASGALTIVELNAPYLRFAKKYYRKGKEQTSEYAGVIAAVRPLKRLYSTTSVDDCAQWLEQINAAQENTERQVFLGSDGRSVASALKRSAEGGLGYQGRTAGRASSGAQPVRFVF